MSGGTLPAASRKRSASTDLDAAMASAMEGEDVPLVPSADADALVTLATDVEAIGGNAVHAEAPADEDALMFDKHAPELARWLDECRAANGGGVATHDDVFFFFEMKYPEVLDHLPQLFHWITAFMEHAAPAASSSPSSMFFSMPETRDEDAADIDRSIPTWVPDAVLRLESTGDLAMIATESGLKSPVTLLYWKNEHAKRELQREHDSHRVLDGAVVLAEDTEAEASVETVDVPGHATTSDAFEASGRHRTAFLKEDELSAWVLGHRFDRLTRQDVMNHIIEVYPTFAATKSPAALKVWTSRFLKRRLANPNAGYAHSRSRSRSSSHKLPEAGKRCDGTSTGNSEATATASSEATESNVDVSAKVKDMLNSVLSQDVVPQSPAADTAVSATHSAGEVTITAAKARPAARKRRGTCSGGYVLHSNEFKLNALRQLDEGKSVSEVAKELGLKNQSSLTYWNSIRDKLAVSEKKRYRLAGGGRRSSFAFEGELLKWVSERHEKGLGTSVKAVLDYMREFHSSFTEGKKEPTLRKWILRFFKRCWRAPPATSESEDTSKAYAFA